MNFDDKKYFVTPFGEIVVNAIYDDDFFGKQKCRWRMNADFFCISVEDGRGLKLLFVGALFLDLCDYIKSVFYLKKNREERSD